MTGIADAGSRMSDTLYERMGGRPHLLRLLHHFYADVRQHSVIGPIFTAQIEDWPSHIEKIANFWSNMTGGPVLYSGPMPARHIPLGLKEEHFRAWLGLWEHNCRVWLTNDCANEMIELAHNVGKRLRHFCGVPQQSQWIGHRGLSDLRASSPASTSSHEQ